MQTTNDNIAARCANAGKAARRRHGFSYEGTKVECNAKESKVTKSDPVTNAGTSRLARAKIGNSASAIPEGLLQAGPIPCRKTHHMLCAPLPETQTASLVSPGWVCSRTNMTQVAISNAKAVQQLRSRSSPRLYTICFQPEWPSLLSTCAEPFASRLPSSTCVLRLHWPSHQNATRLTRSEPTVLLPAHCNSSSPDVSTWVPPGFNPRVSTRAAPNNPWLA